ncbi:MAG: hypothetical protein ABW156_13695 [Jiangellaceae bacterium]
MTGTEVLEVTVHIAATPDTVFPTSSTRTGTCSGWATTMLNAVPGGVFRVRMRDGADDELRAHHRNGWEMYLDRLRGRVHGADPGAAPKADPNA